MAESLWRRILEFGCLTIGTMLIAFAISLRPIEGYLPRFYLLLAVAAVWRGLSAVPVFVWGWKHSLVACWLVEVLFVLALGLSGTNPVYMPWPFILLMFCLISGLLLVGLILRVYSAISTGHGTMKKREKQALQLGVVWSLGLLLPAMGNLLLDLGSWPARFHVSISWLALVGLVIFILKILLVDADTLSVAYALIFALIAILATTALVVTDFEQLILQWVAVSLPKPGVAWFAYIVVCGLWAFQHMNLLGFADRIDKVVEYIGTQLVRKRRR